MDEYLYIQWAKLKADRLKLEREQRAAAQIVRPEPAGTVKERPRAGRRWFTRTLQWRGQS